MRAVIQRCTKASVLVDNEVISSIGRGICVLVGISKDDTKKDIDFMVRKLVNIRLFEDENEKRWCHSVKDKGYEILLVSQKLKMKFPPVYSPGHPKGNKPDFRTAMGPEASAQFYSDFVNALKQAYLPELIKDGKFGAYMQVCIQNDGPVTIELESPLKSVPKEVAKSEEEVV